MQLELWDLIVILIILALAELEFMQAEVKHAQYSVDFSNFSQLGPTSEQLDL